VSMNLFNLDVIFLQSVSRVSTFTPRNHGFLLGCTRERFSSGTPRLAFVYPCPLTSFASMPKRRMQSLSLIQALLKTFTPTEVPVRCARFISRKNWFVCGSGELPRPPQSHPQAYHRTIVNLNSMIDDFHLRVFNYNTSARVAAFEAHPDYIR
jgi:hypothetical protein